MEGEEKRENVRGKGRQKIIGGMQKKLMGENVDRGKSWQKGESNTEKVR